MKYLNIMIIIIIIFINFIGATNTHAQEASIDPETQQQLDELKTEIASKASALKQTINAQLQNKAYVGTIKSNANNSITLATLSGSKIVTVNQDTVYASQTPKKGKATTVTLNTLQTEDYIAALGDIDDTSVLTARKVVLLTGTPDQSKQMLWGNIISISNKMITIKDNTQKTSSITVDDSTIIQNGVNQITLDSLSMKNPVLISGYADDQGVITASMIYVLPPAGSTPPPAATSSASIKPKSSPSITPKTSKGISINK